MAATPPNGPDTTLPIPPRHQRTENLSSRCLRFVREHLALLLLLALMAAALIALMGFLNDAKSAASFSDAVQQRVDAGKLPTEMQVRGIGLHRAALANVGMLIILLATCWWWARPIRASMLVAARSSSFDGTTEEKGRQRHRRNLFSAILLGIFLLTGMLRWNLVSGSMWWDEAWALQNVYLGAFEKAPPAAASIGNEQAVASEALKFVGHEGNWRRALWRYWSPLNHPVASISSQITHAAWLPGQNFAPHEFEEWVLRLPALVAGMIATLLIALTLVRWGFPVAGLVAALLLALHPWAIRHTSEIRAYPFVLAGAAAGVYFLTCILQSRRGSWAAWLGFGLAQILLVWSHIFAASLALCFSITLLALIVFHWPAKSDRLRAIGRLVVINLLAAGVFFQLFGPNIVQALSWAEEFSVGDGNHLNRTGFLDLLTQVTSGMPWDLGATSEAPHLASLRSQFIDHPILMCLAAGVSLVAVGLGIRRLSRDFRPGLWLLLPLLVGAVATMAVIGLGGLYFYPRFLIYLLIPLVVLFAIGISPPLPSLSLASETGVDFSHRRRIALRFGMPIAAVGLFTLAVFPQLQVLNRSSIEPLREVADELHLYRTRLSQLEHSSFQAAGIGHGSDKVRLYFPDATVVREFPSLSQLIANADSTSGHLLVYVGHRYFNKTVHADLIDAIEDDSRFEQLHELPGIKPDFFYRIYRYRNQAG